VSGEVTHVSGESVDIEGSDLVQVRE
jgi:hypothetical protein